MELCLKEGNLLDTKTDVIAHQVNCQGVMGSGVAKQIRDKWPVVFEEYYKLYSAYKKSQSPGDLLGYAQIIPLGDSGKNVANLFGQDRYGIGERHTNYEALYRALLDLKNQMEANSLSSVAFPYKMSSDRGGADWDIILAMIKSIFKNTDITIEIWKYAV